MQNHIDAESVKRLLGEARELRDVDFKREIKLSGAHKHEKAELAKDIIAIANYGGGYLLIGAQQVGAQVELFGMSDELQRAFDSTPINDFVREYCRPAINCTTYKVEVDGKAIGVIAIPSATQLPHIVIKDYNEVLKKSDILTRSAANNSERANPEDLAEILQRCVRNRRADLQAMIHEAAAYRETPNAVSTTIRQTSEVDLESLLSTRKALQAISITPESAIEISRNDLQQLVLENQITLKSGDVFFPDWPMASQNLSRLKSGIYVTHEDANSFAVASYASLQGRVVSVSNPVSDGHSEESDGNARLGYIPALHHILASMGFASRYYGKCGYVGNYIWKYELRSTLPCKLVMDDRRYWPLRGAYLNPMADPIVVERRLPLTTDREALVAQAIDIARELVWYFYLDASVEDIRKLIEETAAKALVL